MGKTVEVNIIWFERLILLAKVLENSDDDNVNRLLGYITSAEIFTDAKDVGYEK